MAGTIRRRDAGSRASPSTKNGAQKRDPEMRSIEEGQPVQYFGMKAMHIGVDAKSGLGSIRWA